MAAKAEKSESGDGLVVTAPLVQVTLSGSQVLRLYKGDVLPDGVTPESLEHLQNLGYVGKP